MNTLSGIIKDILSSEHMSIVAVDIDGDVFSALVLESPNQSLYLRVGHAIDIIFKETEVAIAKNLSGQISMRNRFSATIKNIHSDTLLTTLSLDYRAGDITAIISTKSAQSMTLKVGETIEWLVKTNEVSLCPTT